MQRTRLKPTVRPPDTPTCLPAQASLARGPQAPGALPSGSARVCVCVHPCDLYPCACAAEESRANDTLCHGLLQAEQAPRVLLDTWGPQLPPSSDQPL